MFIRGKINLVIATQFPLKSTEFLAGSPQYNEYISCLEKVYLWISFASSFFCCCRFIVTFLICIFYTAPQFYVLIQVNTNGLLQNIILGS